MLFIIGGITMKKGKSLYMTLMGYFILVLIIPYFVIMILCSLGTYLVRKQVFTANQIIVEQVKSEIDNKLNTFQRYNITTQQKEDLKNIQFQDGMLTTRLRFNIVQMIETVRQVILADSMVSDFLIYLPEQLIISGTGYAYISSNGTERINQQFCYLPNWNEVLSSPHHSELLTTYQENKTKNIYFIDTMNGSFFKNRGYQFVLSLNKEEWGKQIESLLNRNDNAYLAIFNQDTKQMVYTSRPELFQSLGLVQSDDYKENGYLTVSQKNDYYCFMTESKQSNLKFVLLMDVTSIEDSTRWMKILIICCIIATLISSLIILHILKLKEYNSITMTMALVENEQLDQEQTTVFGAVQNIVGKLIKEKQRLQSSLEGSLEYLQKYFLIRLLNQEIEEKDSYLSLLHSYQISFPYQKIRLLLISESFPGEKSNRAEKFEQIQDKILSELDKKYEGKYKAYPILQHGMLQIIINYDLKFEPSDDVINQLYAFRKYVENQSLIVAISREKESCFSLHDATSEANEALEQCLLENNYFKEYQNHRRFISAKQIKYYQYEVNLQHALFECNYNNAEILITNMFNMIRDSFSGNITDVKCKLYGIINLLLEQTVVGNGSEEQLKYIYERLSTEPTIKVIKKSIKEILQFLKDHGSKIQAEDFSADVEQFIMENYQSSSLSVGMIADFFHMELTSLSKRFKKERGINLSDYIHLVRLKKAKELLVNPDVTIKCIAEECGYVNSDVFIKVFKRYEGLTPGKYRLNLFPEMHTT